MKKETPKKPIKSLEQRIKEAKSKFSRSEQSIADFFLSYPHMIPFETNVTMATKIGVSEMTILRFVRTLGYKNLRELKEYLRHHFGKETTELDNAMDRFQIQPNGIEMIKESLELEIQAVIRAYELTGEKQWPSIVNELCRCETVFVAGFQAIKGQAMDFASRLKYIRTGVRFVDDGSSTYSEVLESNPKESCLVIIDVHMYARKAVLLAKKAQEYGIPLIIVTDKFSHWAYTYTDYVLENHTHVKTFWESMASISISLNLLANSVATQLGEQVKEHHVKLKEFGEYFQDFEPSLLGNFKRK